jgi:hypothetical protein
MTTNIGARMLGDIASLMAHHGKVASLQFLQAASLNHGMAVVFGKRYDFFASTTAGWEPRCHPGG